MKKLLTLNDLYNYYSSTKKSTHFSASEDNENIVVQINGKLHFKKNEKDTEGLREVYLQACHIDENINGSNIEESVMTAALPSFSNRPILGYIHDVNGQPEFYGHNMHLDDDGNVVYDEVPIGIIPESCDAKLVYDKDKDKTYVEVKGYIFEEYSKACEILEREQECSVSVELSIRELSYDAKNKYLDIEDFFFSGVTILGKNEDGEIIKPGMTGSNIKLADFSIENNSMFSANDKLVEVLEKINTTLSKFQIDNNQGKEDAEVELEKFEEIIEETTGTTEEVVTEVTEESTEEVTVTEETSEETTEETPEVVDAGTGEETTEQFTEKMVRKFEISHEDTRYALYSLLSSFEELDNDWYWISNVYDSYFVYENWDGTKIYRQSYVKEGDNISFDGERIELFKELLTASEKAELEAMRSNYSSISEKLAKYEAEPEKMKIINSESYAKIAETKEFAELRDNHFDLSVEEVSAKADEILLAYAKGGNLNFSAVSEKKTVGMTKLPIHTKNNKKSRYGSLFSK